MHWDWTSLITTIVPVVVSWLLGCLGVGLPAATPNRIMNKTE